MLKIFFSLLGLLALPLFCKAATLEGVDKIELGSLEILAIKDSDTKMASELLPDLDKYPDLAAYFEHGPIPGVVADYFLKIDGHNVLIDSGWGKDQKITGQTLDLLKQEGVNPDAVSDVLLTHLDTDHIGGLINNELRVFPNAKIWIAKPEYNAWLMDGQIKRQQEKIAFTRKILTLYKDQIQLFTPGEEILPGIRSLPAYGHTPGHTIYEITSDGMKLLIIGDLVQIPKIQLQKPELSTVYDMDSEQAAKTRQQILKMAAENRNLVAGMHFQIISPVLAREDGGFMMREPR